MRRRALHPALAPIVALALLAAVAVGALSQANDEPASTPTAALDTGSSSAPELVVPREGGLLGTAEQTDDDQPVELDPAQDVPGPTRVIIPNIGVDSELEELRTDESGRLASPEQWQQAGWFADGVEPGAIGPAVIAGHVDSPSGPAVFAELEELQPGDVIEVDREDGRTVRFEVDRSEVVGKDDFPTEDVYGPTPDSQLRLITCDGAYVRGSGGYQENLVVWATEAA